MPIIIEKEVSSESLVFQRLCQDIRMLRLNTYIILILDAWFFGLLSDEMAIQFDVP